TRTGIRRIARMVASLDPIVDVVCLQEVESRSLRASFSTWGTREAPQGQLEVLMAELRRALRERGRSEEYVAHYFPAHTYRITDRTNLYTTGLAILVRGRLSVVEQNLGRADDITLRRRMARLKQTRICAHVTVEDPILRRRVDVFNTHLSLPGVFYREFWQSQRRMGFGPNQVAEARRIAAAIAHRRTSDDVVLVGDFNAAPGSPVDRVIQDEAGLVDALGRTLDHERAERWSTAGFMRARMNIDRIYSSPGVRWLDFQGSVPFDEHAAPSFRSRFGFGGLSDHVPLFGTMSLTTRANVVVAPAREAK